MHGEFGDAVRVDTIEELIATLDQIVADARRESARYGYFAALYARMTRGVQAGIEGGRFEDSEKITELDVVFGNRYLHEFEAWRAGRATCSGAANSAAAVGVGAR